jgi:hypothetical protein
LRCKNKTKQNERNKIKTKMTKENELAILLETAHALGCDSYCGQWLASMILPLQDCMRSDTLPEVYYSTDRYEKDARAKELAIVQAATQFAERVMAHAEIEAETLRREAREEIERERAAVSNAYESMLAQARAMVRNLENI